MNDSKEKPPLFQEANLNDLIRVTRLLREFYATAGNVYGIEFDHESALELVGDVIRRGVCLVGPSSCAGALIVPFPFNFHHDVATIVFWYFRRPRESTILQALMEACVAAGATHVDAASLFPSNRIGRFYEKNGMKPAETHYIGELDKCCKRFRKPVRAT